MPSTWFEHDCENLVQLLQTQLDVFPEHRSFLRKRFTNLGSESFQNLESLAEKVVKLSKGQLARYCTAYHWMTEQMMKEDYFFRKNGHYRYSNFDEVCDKVYADAAYMQKYMDGLLISSILWANHSQALQYLVDSFLPRLPNGFEHLEIGPGHGLYMASVAASQKCHSLIGWDVSQTSVDCTLQALKTLKIEKNVSVVTRDIFEADYQESSFDSIVFSEILEHLSKPAEALQILKKLLRPGGLVFINMPINSPAIDHIFNLPTPEDMVDFVKQSGLEVLDNRFFPATNVDINYARKFKYNINCIVIATKV